MQGLDIDIANLIAGKMGVNIELVPVTGPNRVKHLNEKKRSILVSLTHPSLMLCMGMQV